MEFCGFLRKISSENVLTMQFPFVCFFVDAVANVTVAKFGYPQMAIGAALGGPIFNLLIGVGVAMTVNTLVESDPFPFPGNGHITLSVIFVTVLLVMNIGFIVANKWRLTKLQGTISFVVYVLYIFLNILIAVDVIDDF